MGKITDAAIAIFVIIIGFFVLYRLGITLPMFEKAIRHFFYGSSSSVVLPAMFITSNAKLKMKAENKKEEEIRVKLFHFLRKVAK